MVGSKIWSHINTEPFDDLDMLTTEMVEGNQYIFKVCAENKAGRGPYSEPSDPVLCKDPYGEWAFCNGVSPIS